MMKFKFLTLILLFSLLATTATAETANKDLPLKAELENFTSNVSFNYSYTTVASSRAIDEHPTWKHDIWEDAAGKKYISFYYRDDNSSKGYGSIYYDDCGKKLPRVCGIVFELIEKYNGEKTSVEINNTIENKTVINITEPENSTIEDVKEPVNENPSEISVFMKNSTSGDSIKIESKISETTEEKRNRFIEMCKNAWNFVYWGD